MIKKCLAVQALFLCGFCFSVPIHPYPTFGHFWPTTFSPLKLSHTDDLTFGSQNGLSKIISATVV